MYDFIFRNSDAAHRVHPLAGQGLNLGFGDVACLTEHLAAASFNGAVLGDRTHLRAYETERLRHNVPIMLGIHGIQKMYGTQFAPAVLARSVGLQLVNGLAPIKVKILNMCSFKFVYEFVYVSRKCSWNEQCDRKNQ